jgi:hypothetical protein
VEREEDYLVQLPVLPVLRNRNKHTQFFLKGEVSDG